MSTDLVVRNTFTSALKASRLRIRNAQWSAAMARIMHAMAVHGSLGPAGLSVATNYLAVLEDLAAERGPDFAITYDRDLRRHLQSEMVPVAEVTSHLRTLDDVRAAAMQRKFNNEKSDKSAATRRPAPPPKGGKGGKGASQNNWQKYRDRGQGDRNRHHDRGHSDNRDNRDNHGHQEVKVKNQADGGARPWKRRRQNGPNR